MDLAGDRGMDAVRTRRRLGASRPDLRIVAQGPISLVRHTALPGAGSKGLITVTRRRLVTYCFR